MFKNKPTIETVSSLQRRVLVENAWYLIDHAALIHYAEVRPMKSMAYPTWASVRAHLGDGGQLTMDCSEAVTSLFRWSGLRDPNGLGYNGYGFTGTLSEHLPHYNDVADAHPGALVLFQDPAHVAMVMERNGDNPWLFSHGSEDGPYHIPLSDEAAYHNGPITFLDIGNL